MLLLILFIHYSFTNWTSALSESIWPDNYFLLSINGKIIEENKPHLFKCAQWGPCQLPSASFIFRYLSPVSFSDTQFSQFHFQILSAGFTFRYMYFQPASHSDTFSQFHFQTLLASFIFRYLQLPSLSDTFIRFTFRYLASITFWYFSASLMFRYFHPVSFSVTFSLLHFQIPSDTFNFRYL